MSTIDPLEERCISVVRALAMDGPQAANSGHQGTAMAPVAAPGAGTEVGEPADAAQDAPQADGALANTGATGWVIGCPMG